MRVGLFLFLIGAGVAVAQSTVSIPSTAARRLAGDLDGNWLVDSQVQGQEWIGEAAIVLKPGGGWAAPESGAGWIGPNHDQSNASRPASCCAGRATYTLNFNVDDPETAQVQMRIAVDDTVTMYLNGTGMESIVYSTVEPTFSSPVAHTLKHGAPYVGPFGVVRNTMRFVKGRNSLRVVVLNTNGPTGLYIAVTPPRANSGPNYSNTAPSDYGANSAEDPVDSASGQFYDTEVDFRLGGPMALAFERYYGSQLSRSGGPALLGPNWMGTFDASAQIEGTNAGATARVLLFGGRVVTFTNVAGAWQLTSPRSTAYQFAAAGLNFQLLDPVTQWVYTFTAAGALTRIEDRNGNAITITQGTGGPLRAADNNGRSLTFAYITSAGAPLLSSVTDHSGRAVRYAYTAGLLTSVTDAIGNVTRYAYSPSGALLTRQTLPLGNSPTTQTYDASARVLTQADPAGNTIRLAYDAPITSATGGTTITSPTGTLTRHKSDATGSITELTDATGAASTTTYDAAGRPATVVDKNGNTRRYTYHAGSGLLASVTDELGKTTTLTYTAQTKAPFTFYNLTGIAYSDGTKATLTHDANGNVTAYTTPDGATTRYTYDASGRRTQVTGPTNSSTTFTWNTDGTLASAKDALGNTTTYRYDALKRLTGLTNPNGATAQFAYDANGQRTSEAIPGNPASTSAYDANGQLISWAGVGDNKYAYTYTATGKLATATDPRGGKTTYTYDAEDRLAKIQNPAGEAVTLAYTPRGELASVTDDGGPRTTFTYDAAGRLLSETDATGRQSTWSYDAAGNILSTGTTTGNKNTYTYDDRGSRLSETNPLGETTTFTRDALGRLLSTTLPGGLTSQITRDAAGRPTSLTSPEGNKWLIQWDALGRLSSMTDPLGNQGSFTYQGLHLAKVTTAMGSLTFTNDAAGRPVKLEYSDATVFNRSYDASGFLLSTEGLSLERDAMGNIIKSNGLAIDLDAEGRMAKLTYAADKSVSYTYDAAGRVNSVADWLGGKTGLRYDAGSRVEAITYPNGIENLWEYDADGYVKGITYGRHGSIVLTRDAAGRVISAQRNLPAEPLLREGVQEFTYGPGSRLTSATYDAQGRVTAQGDQNFTWDLASRLTAVSTATNSGKLTYDGLGAMTSSSAAGANQTYVVNYATKLTSLATVRSADADQRYYVYLPSGELLYSIDAADGARRFYHFDEMGNTVLLTSDAGEVTDTYAITPYGEVVDRTGTTPNPFTFQGKFGVMQEGPALFSMRARHYDATSARFLSPDPRVGSAPQESEPYVYANANPIQFADPLGLWPFDGLIEAIGNAVKAVGEAISNVVSPKKPKPEKPKAEKPAPEKPKPAPKPPAPPKLPPLPPPPPVRLVPPPIVTPPSSPLVVTPIAPLIGNDGSTLIGNDGSTLIGNDGSTLIGNDGSTLIGNDGSTLIGNDGSTLIGNDGSTLIGNDGSTAVPPSPPSLRGPNAYKGTTTKKAKNNKR